MCSCFLLVYLLQFPLFLVSSQQPCLVWESCGLSWVTRDELEEPGSWLHLHLIQEGRLREGTWIQSPEDPGRMWLFRTYKDRFHHLCLSSCCRRGILPGYRGWQPRLLRKSCQPALVQHVPVVRMDFWHVWDSASTESTGGVSPGQGQWPDPYLLSVGINIYKYGFSAQRARLSLSLTWLFGALGKRPS